MLHKLKWTRKKRSLSQIELSNRLGVGSTSIGNWESNRTTMPAEIVPKICKELGISPNELFGWEEQN